MNVITLDILSWWHAGTGRGMGATADAQVNRSAEGLPYLPGRSVKGLLRSAVQIAEQCGQATAGRSEFLFGSRLPATGPGPVSPDDAIDAAFQQARYETKPGILRFTSATLDPAWLNWARKIGPMAPELDEFFHLIASTSVGDDGIVAPHTLRTVEVAVPMKLSASVSSTAGDSGWLDDLKRAAPLIRHIGMHRNRGLGRVLVSVE